MTEPTTATDRMYSLLVEANALPLREDIRADVAERRATYIERKRQLLAELGEEDVIR
jgi:hypothetical protein